jgi:hypothetical protein
MVLVPTLPVDPRMATLRLPPGGRVGTGGDESMREPAVGGQALRVKL